MVSELTLDEEVKVLRRLLAHICGTTPEDIKVEKLPLHHPYDVNRVVAYEYDIRIHDPVNPEKIVAMFYGMKEHGIDVMVFAEDDKVIVEIELGPDYYNHWFKTVVEK